MEWLTERAKESVGSLHHALKGAEKDVPARAAGHFASLLTALVQVLSAIDAFLDALRSKKEAEVPPGLAVKKREVEEEDETPDLHTPPRR